MNKTQRNEMILLKELNTQKIIDIKQAMNLLGVSESTVRRLPPEIRRSAKIEKHLCLKLSYQLTLAVFHISTVSGIPLPLTRLFASSRGKAAIPSSPFAAIIST